MACPPRTWPRCQAPGRVAKGHAPHGGSPVPDPIAGSRLDEPANAADLRNARGAEFRQDVGGVHKFEGSGDADRLAVAAPQPVFGALDETRSDRVPRHIAERLENRLGRLLAPRPIPVTHEVAGPPMPIVEAPRVAADEPMHPRGERVVGEIDDRMPVRREQANRDAPPGKPVDRRDEEPEPCQAIEVVLEVDGSSGRTVADVLDSGSEITRSSWQGVSFGPEGRRRKMSSADRYPVRPCLGAWHQDVAGGASPAAER